jgi:hypothetical protein
MPGGRCACAGVLGPVQLPESRDFGRTPGSDYHEEGCLCVCHDDDPVLRDLWLDVVLPERHEGALHNPELHLQRDPEDSRVMEREGIRVVAARRSLGSRIQSPPPPYHSGEEHHGLQQGASRASSPNGSAPGKTDEEVLLLQGGTVSNHEGARTPDEDAAANSPYSSAARQLIQAREQLALQKREAAETLDNVHGYYERKMRPPPPPERPSALDA